MYLCRDLRRGAQRILTVAAVIAVGGQAFAQEKAAAIPDAQVEASVLKALASNPQLADQTISSTTVYGTVTLSGSVRDEASRTLAENVVSRTGGVKKVVDELTIPGEASAPADARQSAGTDGMPAAAAGVPPSPADQQGYQQGAYDPTANGGPQQAGAYPPPQPPYGQQSPAPSDPGASGRPPSPVYRQPYPPQGSYPQQPYGDPQGPYPQQPYGPQGSYPQQPYGQQQRYPQQAPYPGQGGNNGAPPPYGAQVGGQPVVVPSGALLRVRINQGLDSQHTQAGTVFDGVVLNDVVAENAIAIPRGATVQGTVANTERAGALKGRGQIALHLTQVTLGGRTFPLVTDTWTHEGADKTGRTLNNAIGLGATGAVIGAIAGRGAGAAIGAGVGGAVGLGTSAASGGGQAEIPSEAILTFHLTQPAQLTTVSQAEMDRLGYGVPVGAQSQPVMRRRFGPPPSPYVYGPVYYPRYYRTYPY